MATRIPRAAPVKWPHPGGEAPSTGASPTGGAGGRLGAALDTALPGVSSLKSSTLAGRTNPAAELQTNWRFAQHTCRSTAG
jgi:hypothetical protein